jgi:hypothetical protein
MADTAALVVALSAQLTKFEKDMRQAGIMAEKAVGDIENKFSKINPKISTSFFGNFLADMAGKGLESAVKAVGDLVDRFKELQKTAEYTGLSLQWLYGLQEAGVKAGASVAQMSAAASAVALSLDEMKRNGEGALKVLLDANPKFLKGLKADALDASQALQIVSEILRNLPLLNAINVGKSLGIPEGAIIAMRSYGEAITAVADASAKAAPDLQRMAEMAKLLGDAWDAFAAKIKEGAIEGAFVYLNYLASTYKMLLEAILPVLSAINAEAGNMAGKAIAQLQTAQDALAKARETPTGDTTLKRIVIRGGGSAVDPTGRKASGGAANQTDEFQRANDQITKNIALLDAQTKTMFQNVGAQAAARAEASLMEAERRRLNLAEGAAVPINEELRKKIDAQAAAMSRATLENAKAAQQLQRINEAYDTFGSSMSTAFADAIIEGKKLNEVLSSLLKTLARAAINSTITGLFNSFKPGAFAGGTDYAPGGMALVGERGPELVNLPRGSQVIPNNVLRNSGGSSITAPVNVAIDARGASVEAVARLAQVVGELKQTLPSTIVGTIQQARRGRVPGV